MKSYKLKFGAFKIFEALSREKNCFFLDSSLNSNYALGRYSFLGIDPFLTLKASGPDPFKELRKILSRYKITLAQNTFPFFGGAVGYLAYDLGLSLEKKIKVRNKPGISIPDCFFNFYNNIVIIDHLKQALYILSLGIPEKNYHLAKSLAQTNFKKIQRLFSRINFAKNREKINKCFSLGASQDKSASPIMQLESNFTREEYLRAVEKAKAYIKAGDIYQVNLSQRFKAKSNLSAFEIYQRLRKLSPSYFSAYFDAGDFQILSSSPERFLSLGGGLVTTRPMKGTRPRSKNRLQDIRFKRELLESTKDRAELVMIVDLERNDLGRVCSYDSIRVPTLRELEEYNTVFQTTATISGRLHKDKDGLDLLRACFPGGSITGCPKIRAMEIVEELEPDRRSIYTGCLGYLSFSGNMDLNILIRTILKKEDQLYFGAGGGIVADSKPEDEYQETLVKARAMTEAIKP